MASATKLNKQSRYEFINSNTPKISIANKYKIISLICLLLMCVHLAQAGGKGGKVPIYMPIPFPVPMPMPQKPPMPASHQHGHYGSNHESGGEGEVKKIYILQPMGRLPHSQKGGYGGHMQHMPSPVNYKTKSAPRPSFVDEQQEEIPPQGDSYGPASKPHQDQHSSHKGGFHTDEQLKILPIVVIPPIAPMTPIQLSHPAPQQSHSQGDSHGGGGSKRPFHSSSFNDQKSFADYGGSGGGSAFRTRSQGEGGIFRGSASAPAFNGDLDDFLDDYDSGPGSSSSNWRSSSAANRRTNSGNAAFRRSRQNNQPSRRHLAPMRIKSIRDILEQATIFDDEPTSGGVGVVSAASNGRGQHCCNGNSGQRYRGLSANELAAASMLAGNADRGDAFNTMDYDYRFPSSVSGARFRSSDNNNLNFLADSNLDNPNLHSENNRADINNYNDFSEQARNQLMPRRSKHNNYHRNQFSMDDSGLVQMQDQDDQSRYDSIKSVVHENPDSSNAANKTHPITTRPMTKFNGTKIKDNDIEHISDNQLSNKLYRKTTETSSNQSQMGLISIDETMLEKANTSSYKPDESQGLSAELQPRTNK